MHKNIFNTETVKFTVKFQNSIPNAHFNSIEVHRVIQILGLVNSGLCCFHFLHFFKKIIKFVKLRKQKHTKIKFCSPPPHRVSHGEGSRRALSQRSSTMPFGELWTIFSSGPTRKVVRRTLDQTCCTRLISSMMTRSLSISSCLSLFRVNEPMMFG